MKIRYYWFILLWLLLGIVFRANADDIVYPAGANNSGVIDVTSLPAELISEGLTSLDKTGVSDNRTALQALVDRYKGQTNDNPNLQVRILYFPSGTYRLSGAITGVTYSPGGGGILFQGESRTNTILKLDDNATGYGSASAPKSFISFFEDEWSNNMFYNGIENLTIDTGSGNPGAVALAFSCNNVGYIRNVLVRTGGNGSQAGHSGILLNSGADLLAETLPNGIGLMNGIEVRGFQYGINSAENTRHGFSMEDIRLSGQTVAGIRINKIFASIRNITSSNTVPGLVVVNPMAQVVVLDSDFSGGSSASAAIESAAGTLFARNVTQTGYRAIIEDDGTDVTTDLSNDEYLSSASTALKLWDSTPSRSLDIPIVDTPEVPWDTDLSDWAFVDPAAQYDDTAAFQAALDSGASTICVRTGNDTIRISSTLVIGPNVRRIIGQWHSIAALNPLYSSNPGEPLFRFATNNHPAVVIEKFRSSWNTDRKYYFIQNESSSDLVLKDIFWSTAALYRNSAAATGRFFAEDIHVLPGSQDVDVDATPAGIIVSNQTAYFRQINPEQFNPGIVNDGGTVWIFGFKVGETKGPVVRSINGATTEILGGVMNMTHDLAPASSNETRILDIEDSNVSAILFEHFEGVGNTAGLSWGKNFYVAVETRGDETRYLTNALPEAPRRPDELGAVIPLYVGYRLGATIAQAQDELHEGDSTTNAFVVGRGTFDNSGDQTISYTVSGTTASGSDFQTLSGSVVIPDGQGEVMIPVTLVDDQTAEMPETLTVTLQPGAGYALGPVTEATVSIHDDDFVQAPGADCTLNTNSTNTVQVTLYNPSTNDQLVAIVPAADSDNYSWVSSKDEGGPTYNWIEISGTGTKVLSNDDSGFYSTGIGFEMPYYGLSYTQVCITVDGLLWFTNRSVSTYLNRDLRGTNSIANGYPLTLAPFWEDLDTSASTNDAVYYQQIDADTFVVQWQQAQKYGSSATATFELILKSSGEILFQYKSLDSTPQTYTYTVGAKNEDGTKWVQVSYRASYNTNMYDNPDYLEPLMAIRLSPAANWVAVETNQVLVPAGSNATVNLFYDSSGYETGTVAQTSFSFVFPDPEIGTVTLPVSMTVQSSAEPPPAEPLVYEGFDYAAGTLGTANGGTGWSSPWGLASSGGTVSGSAQATVGTPSLSIPSDYTRTTTDGKISDLISGGSDARQFNDHAIDLGTDTTRYFSFLWNESGSGGFGIIDISFLSNDSFTRRVFELKAAASQMSLLVNNSATTVGSTAFTAGSDYLLVGKIVATANGADTICFSIFENGTAIGSEPGSWQVSGTIAATDQSAVINRLMVQGSNNIDQFDEFMIGETFASVTGISATETYINNVPVSWILNHWITTNDYVSTDDDDLDGVLNQDEYIADTLPRNSNSVLRLLGIQFNGLTNIVNYQNGGSGANVYVAYSTNLVSGSFVIISTNYGPVATSNSYNHSAGNLPAAGFYRLEAERND